MFKKIRSETLKERYKSIMKTIKNDQNKKIPQAPEEEDEMDIDNLSTPPPQDDLHLPLMKAEIDAIQGM